MNLTLPRLRLEAIKKYGDGTPSLVTIKRMSAKKAFDGKTLEESIDLIGQKIKTPDEDQPAKAMSAVGPIPGLVLPADQQARFDEAINNLINATTRVESIRHTLMLKYDAVAASQSKMIEELQRRIQEMSKESSTDMDIRKIMAMVSNLGRVTFRIDELSGQVAEIKEMLSQAEAKPTSTETSTELGEDGGIRSE